MTEKYIVELKDRETLYKVAIGGNGEPYISTAMKNVYKEPNLEAIRNEAYEKGVQDTKQHWVDAPRSCAYKLGYENGLNAAWDAAWKISTMDSPTRDKIFKKVITTSIIEGNTASEAIEKIRQYEHEKEEQIQVGDEVIDSRARIGVCTGFFGLELDEIYVMWRDGSSGKWDKKQFNKTGMHYPGITEAIKKMKERNDVDKNKSGDS